MSEFSSKNFKSLTVVPKIFHSDIWIFQRSILFLNIYMKVNPKDLMFSYFFVVQVISYANVVSKMISREGKNTIFLENCKTSNGDLSRG